MAGAWWLTVADPLPLSPADRYRRLSAQAAADGRTLVMGILNITPDSFSDGGQFSDADRAVAHARAMVAEGADIIDIGGESTRPGAAEVSEAEEMDRVVPVVGALASVLDVPISVDTRRASVARAAVGVGAAIVNDISAFTHDGAMAATVAELAVPACLMHMKGTPADMQSAPSYEDVVEEVREYLRDRAVAATDAGVAASDIIVDPGFGFGKTVTHNLLLVRDLARICSLGYRVLLGVSRKSTLGVVLGGAPVGQRHDATAALTAIGIANGAAIVRVHDVAALARVARAADAVRRGAAL